MKKQENSIRKNNRSNSRLDFAVWNKNLPKSKRSNSHFDFLFGNKNLLKSKRSPRACTRDNNLKFCLYKRSQVTIFIILALIIVVAIALIFVVFRKPTINIPSSTDPAAYVENCIKEYAKEAIENLSKRGGDIKPEGSVKYKGEDIAYLCYNTNFYKPCVNQRPLLIEHIEKEITSYIEPKMRRCFSSLEQELKKKGYEIETGSMNIITELKVKKVVVTIDKEFSMTKEETRKFEQFSAQISHPIYELAEIAMEIANQEARYCYFENLGFMITYPRYDIRKFETGNSDIIYTIKDKPTGKEFTFAIRSCAMPAGL